MPNEMPDSAGYGGLKRKVLEYSEEFRKLITKLKQPGFRDADWAGLA